MSQLFSELSGGDEILGLTYFVGGDGNLIPPAEMTLVLGCRSEKAEASPLQHRWHDPAHK
jgi:hypothetical protein